MNRKLVIIGAGSAVFTQGLVMDMIAAGGQWNLGLVDTSEEALELIDLLVRRMVKERDAEVTVSASTNRRDILPGADYVVSTIGVGGRRGWERDVFIPRRYGVFQPVGDTTMPGGIARALRMIPALVDIATDIESVCPAARFFNYANPMTANCAAIRRATGVPVVGLCHGVNHSTGDLARALGVPREELTHRAVGLNHLTFVHELRRSGIDLLPDLREWIASRRREGLAPESVGALWFGRGADAPPPADPFSWSLFEVFGAYPVPGDRHVTEFFPELFPGGRYYGKQLGVDAFGFEPVIASGDAKYEEMGRLARQDEPLGDAFFARFGGEHEQLLAIIGAIERDERRVFSANLPNGSAYPNLPADAVLELPALASSGGLVALPFADFPDRLVPVISRRLDVVSCTVEAALSGDRALVAEAIRMDGSLTDERAIFSMTDELLRAQAEFLPQF